MEHKQTEAVVTAVDEAQGIVEAVWAVMGNIDDGNDIIHPGAFTKTFSQNAHQVKLLDNHRTDSVMASLGLVKELREVRPAELPQELMDKYPDATGGAKGTFQFFLDTPEGKGVFTRIQRKAIMGWSFGYDTVKSDRSFTIKDGEKVPVRNLRELRLFEVSPVLWPMNPATTTTDAKSADDAKPAETQEADESTSNKEMTEHGPMRRLGDVLQGSIHKIFTLMCDDWYTQGFMDRDERIVLSSLIGDALEILASGMPEELSKRPLQMTDMYYMSDDVQAELKAGRVLNARIAKRIIEAVDNLHQCLKDAGLMEMPEDENDNTGPQKSDIPSTSDASGSQPEPDGAGTDNDSSTRLLKLIEIEQEKLKLLEV